MNLTFYKYLKTISYHLQSFLTLLHFSKVHFLFGSLPPLCPCLERTGLNLLLLLHCQTHGCSFKSCRRRPFDPDSPPVLTATRCCPGSLWEAAVGPGVGGVMLPDSRHCWTLNTKLACLCRSKKRFFYLFDFRRDCACSGIQSTLQVLPRQ